MIFDLLYKLFIDYLKPLRKKLLGGKPSYALFNGRVYYIDENLEWEEVPVIHGDMSELHAIFPTTLGEVQDASRDEAIKLASLTGHSPILNRRRDSDGMTPAYLAAQNGHPEVIEMLARYSADLNQATAEGGPPVLVAAQQGHGAVIEMLAKCGASLKLRWEKNGATAACFAAQNGHVEVIEVLAKYGADLNLEIEGGKAPAYLAAKWGHLEVIKMIAELGADLNKRNKSGETPAMIAAGRGHLEIVQIIHTHVQALRKVRDECDEYLDELGSDKNDSILIKYVREKRSQLSLNACHLKKLSAIKDELLEIRAVLNSPEVKAVQSEIHRLQSGASAFTFKKREKANELERAMYETPLLQRRQVISGPPNAVQEALAKHCSWRNKAIQKGSTGQIDETHAAKVYKALREKFQEESAKRIDPHENTLSTQCSTFPGTNL